MYLARFAGLTSNKMFFCGWFLPLYKLISITIPPHDTDFTYSTGPLDQTHPISNIFSFVLQVMSAFYGVFRILFKIIFVTLVLSFY